MGKIALAEMISSLRSELQQAQDEGQDKKLHFVVGDVEMELQVTVTKEGTVGGGVKFWVYDASLSGKVAEQMVQKIKIKLAPVGSDGGTLKISDSGRPGLG
ncbi:MAG: hypothetical protein HQL74_14565 [Magnetococcales bacterium]|nr:hypothetical protein [Magnetococcales bacterium]